MCRHEFITATKGWMDKDKSMYPISELMKICKNCRKTVGEIDLEQQLAAAKARMKRMEEALKMARTALVRADSDTSYIAHRYSHVLTAANCPLTEEELLKTSGMCISAEKAVKAALEEKP